MESSQKQNDIREDPMAMNEGQVIHFLIHQSNIQMMNVQDRSKLQNNDDDQHSRRNVDSKGELLELNDWMNIAEIRKYFPLQERRMDSTMTIECR
jgi:hypothetical protein